MWLRNRAQTFFLILMRIHMNSGPPTMALMTPTGSPLIPETFAMVSAMRMNAAPKAAEAGMR